MTTKKTINIEQLKMEQLKEIISNINNVSDVYQNTQLRIMFLQALNTLTLNTVNDLPTGREALDNTKKKENNKETMIDENNNINKVIEEPVTKEDASVSETIESVNMIKNAIAEVAEDTGNKVIDITEKVQQEAEEAQDLEVVEEVQQVQEEAIETTEEELPGMIVEEDLLIDAGDGTEVNIKDAYNLLRALEDNDSKQYIAFYLSYYDAESIAAITNAFSSGITSDPFELLNKDNADAFLEYFNSCLEM